MYMRQGGLAEQSGIGDYEKTGNWEWEYYPPPYDFLAPSDSAAMPAPILPARGVGCAGDCGCGGACGHAPGIGLFDSTDFTQWGFAEWGTIAVGAYLVISIFSDMGKASKTIKRGYSRRRSRSQRRERLQKELETV
jgi:hypothetical protein